MKQFLTLTLVLVCYWLQAQEKRIHFAHGLDKSDNSWGLFSDKLKTACPGIETTTYQMSLTNGIDAYSNQFIENLQDFGATKNDIAIGHSFGGVNLRNIDSQNLDLFGAYITVGSPHLGSKLANSTLNGELEAWVTLGCKDVVADPIASLISLFGFDPPTWLIDDAGFFMCDLVFGILMEQAETFVGSGLGIDELVLDGPIANLPEASIPAISITCSSDYHIMWNLLQGAVESKYPNSINGKPFSVFAKFIQDNTLATSKLLSNISYLNRFGFLNFHHQQQLKKASREFLESYTWMRNSEAVWSELIGAGGGVTWIESQTEIWACDCYNINTGAPVPCDALGSSDEITIYDIDPFSTCAQTDNEDCWIIENTSTPVFGEDLPSDGLLPVHSQSQPGAIHQEHIQHLSHFEQPFNAGLHQILLKNLNPLTAPHQVFKIPECL